MPIGSPVLAPLELDLRRIAAGEHHDPHAILGAHGSGGRFHVLLFIPGASDVRLEDRFEAARVPDSDFFLFEGKRKALPAHYRVSWAEAGHRREQVDPYCFEPLVDAQDTATFTRGNHYTAWRFLGAHAMTARVGRRRALRGVGAECGTGQRGGPLLPVGRPPLPDAHRSARAASGSCSCRASASASTTSSRSAIARPARCS